jgi:hypothetical protein
MKPKIPLPSDAVNELGMADTTELAPPAISAARQNLRRTAFRMRTVDPVLTELVRIRNGRFQNCFF